MGEGSTKVDNKNVRWWNNVSHDAHDRLRPLAPSPGLDAFEIPDVYEADVCASPVFRACVPR